MSSTIKVNIIGYYAVRIMEEEKDYGKGALDTLIGAMLGENPVMIFAGYPAQMEDFIKLNPRFKRRIKSVFHFQDYTCEGLTGVFMCKVQQRGFKTDMSLEELTDAIENKTAEAFRREWNTGFCDRLFELAKENLGQMLLTASFGVTANGCELLQICKEDIHNSINYIHRIKQLVSLLLCIHLI